jgi:gluconolactonase
LSGERVVRKLADGLGFTEGPIWGRDGHVTVTSIDHGRIYRITDDGVDVLAETGGGANGAVEGLAGDIYVAQNGGRWGPRKPVIGSSVSTGGIQVARDGGHVEWLSKDQFAPNDLCFGPDGFIYVTDPTRGRGDDGRLWRCDPVSGESELLTSVRWFPNGIGFGPEDDALYVASTRTRSIMRFPLDGGGLGQPEVAIQMAHGRPDGFAFDVDGNLVIAAISHSAYPGAIQTWSPDGELLDIFHPGAAPLYTNVALSPEGQLAITAASEGAVLKVDGWPCGGLLLHPFRNHDVSANAETSSG